MADKGIALLALVVALSGTAYAATQLEPNSVGTKHIKDRAVTKQKISRRALADLRGPRGLPGEPGAPGAPGAQGPEGAQGPAGQDAPPIESLQLISPGPAADENCLGSAPAIGQFCTERGTPGAYGHWFNLAALAPAGYFKDRSGLVHLQGTVASDNTPGHTVFVLPTTHRPTAIRLFRVFDNSNHNHIRIKPDGRVVLGDNYIGGSSMLQLDGISFRP